MTFLNDAYRYRNAARSGERLFAMATIEIRSSSIVLETIAPDGDHPREEESATERNRQIESWESASQADATIPGSSPCFVLASS